MRTLRGKLFGAATGLTMAVSFGSGASAGVIFTTDESIAQGGTIGCNICTGLTVTADQFGLTDAGLVTFTSPTTFTETGSVTITSFLLGGVTQSGTALNFKVGPLTGYSLLANFQATGSFVPAGGGLAGTFSSFDVQLFLAPISTKNAGPGADKQYSTAGTDLLGSGTLVTGQAHLFPNQVAQGDYHVFETFAPTTDGLKYFTSPVNLSLDLFDTSGNNNTSNCVGPVIPPATTPSCSIVDVEGGGKAAFDAVPEPGTLVLVGGGLLALSLARRRVRAA
jgi:hypothetical protein